MADPNAVGTAFVNHYYNVFDTNRAGLQSLYQAQSMLTFEGQQLLGPEAIVGKLTSLPFQAVKHQVSTCDVQPAPNGILVFVCGQLVVDEDPNPLKFSQVFQLLPLPDNSGYWVFNDMFRLNYS
eukprot:JP447770.1.p2 GENE.JP447770.1~~JP447770.1.p2  ORF type:complete len:124 (+),score=35.42 JP447770.1:60-431(+)